MPAQALILLNDPFVHQQTELWAKRVLARPGGDEERIGGMYLSAFGRPPTDAELRDARLFLDEQTGQYPADEPLHPWTDLAHVLLNVKEFIFID